MKDIDLLYDHYKDSFNLIRKSQVALTETPRKRVNPKPV